MPFRLRSAQICAVRRAASARTAFARCRARPSCAAPRAEVSGERVLAVLDGMVALIRAEARAAKAGKRSRIMAKMNSLLEEQIIEELYKASQAGVKIDLIVRGVCALRAGVPGLSENIRVRSIVGRFLEHSRVFYFYAEGAETVYLSSADWMDRNFFRRVEIAFPIYDKTLKKRVIDEAFTYALRDNQLAWQQQADGDYVRVRSRREPFNLHQYLMQKLGV